LYVSELFSEPPARRQAGQLPEIARQMGLVEIAALSCDVGQRSVPASSRSVLETAAGDVEPDNAAGGLRRQADLFAKTRLEVPAAPPHLAHQPADSYQTTRG
jgi:hypothetical protein